MPKANQATNTNRRRLLAGVTTLGGASGGILLPEVPSATSLTSSLMPGPDAGLIALCATYQAVRVASEAIYQEWGNAYERDIPANIRKARHDPTTELWQVRDAISIATATTMASLVAKASMVMDDLSDGGACPAYDPERASPRSLTRDLLRLTGGAA